MGSLRQFAVDLLEGAVIGAAYAALALPDGFGDANAALVVLAAAAIGGVKTVARARLKAWLDSRKAVTP